MLIARYFKTVQSQQFKVGGMCTSTSYGRLQLRTCMYLLVFIYDWVFAFSCHYCWASYINCLCWFDHSCMDLVRMCDLWWDRNIRWWLYLMPPTIVINVVSHWTLNATPIIDLFFSSLRLFSPCMKMYFSLPRFC
jgi:hypothetical protein